MVGRAQPSPPRLATLLPFSLSPSHSLFQVFGVDQPLDGRILAGLLGFAHLAWGRESVGSGEREREIESKHGRQFTREKNITREEHAQLRALSGSLSTLPPTPRAYLSLVLPATGEPRVLVKAKPRLFSGPSVFFSRPLSLFSRPPLVFFPWRPRSPPMTSRICVKGLPKSADEARLRSYFGARGEVTDARVMRTP